MGGSSKRRYIIVVFIFLLFLGTGLRLWRLGIPPVPVFDEIYFSTFAAQDALGEPYFDIHPPLGKLILALPLFSKDHEALKNANFIKTYRSPTSSQIITDYRPSGYKNFPYADLRLISVFSGLAFLSALFFFVRELAGDKIALLAMFFAVFENALLLHTRLILLDGMYLALGLFGLYLFFKKYPRLVLGGLFFGAALAVKLTALALIGPALILWMLSDDKKTAGKNFLKFCLVSLGTLLALWFSVNALLFSPGEKLASFNEFMGTSFTPAFWTPIIMFLKDVLVSFFGYTLGGDNSMMSPWYGWPVLLKTIYYYNSGMNIHLVGNIFVWYLSTLAVLAAIVKFARDGIKKIGLNEEYKPALILLGGYIFALVPFFTIIRRATFLYHYFPALVFAIGIAAFLIVKFLENRQGKIKIAVLSAIVILTVIGFTVSAPYTYGL